MKKFVLLYRGSRDMVPTDESMAAWGEWFTSLGDKVVDAGNPFGQGREVTSGGTTELPLDADGVTGYTLINALDIDEAEKIALSHPTVPAIQVFEAMPM
ncbi:hypothetical protein [Aeromicrobium sp.]|uniref:hypothetical protein n=1 Tax=Aeromicrobium sp. TaxID=1871063 RepID=UPI003D6A039C